MPLLLAVVMWLSFSAAALFFVGAAGFATGYFGRPGASWVAPWLLLLGAVALVTALGIRGQRPWARPLIVGIWAAWSCGNLVVYGIYRYGHGPAYLHWVPALYLAAFGWYLYMKPNVRFYFATLKSRQA